MAKRNAETPEPQDLPEVDETEEEDDTTFEALAGAKLIKTEQVEVAEIDEIEETTSFSSMAPIWHFEDPPFEAGDLAMVRIKLLQAMSPEVNETREGMPGQFYAKGFGAFDEIDIIPQAVAKTRELWNDDGKRIGVSPNAVDCCLGGGRKCATCPNAQWDRTDPENAKPPKCQIVWRYIVVSPTLDAMGEISFQRTQIPTASFINLQVKLKGLGKVGINLTSSQEKGKGPKGGYYFIPKPVVAQIEPETLEAARAMAAPKKALPAQTVETATAQTVEV